ncbi:MAG: quinone oxidoreductase [Pirellulaceae bacterium]|nr:MAG: quinone oxidoreductase [Pirellulaceae bacterium]
MRLVLPAGACQEIVIGFHRKLRFVTRSFLSPPCSVLYFSGEHHNGPPDTTASKDCCRRLTCWVMALMKAAYIERTGPPEVIQYGDLPKPQPQDRQVLVRVTAVSVNPIDTYIRNGANYWPLPQPFIIGCDLAGVVEQLGPEARRFQVGDRVWGSNQGLLGRQGTFAEYCAVDEQWLYPIPEGVDDKDAAACALVGITAHLGLFREAGLNAGETLFIQGGTGGVGSMVLQMAKAIGARVITTGGSDDKVKACLEMGADLAINYRTQDVVAEVRRFCPAGVDVYWETVRDPNFDRIIEMLAERGRIVIMAGRDARPQFPVGPFYVKECSMHGFVMFKAPPEVQRAAAEEINTWLADGKLKARISRVLPLSAAAEAHRLQEENTIHKKGTLDGKIVLVPNSHS